MNGAVNKLSLEQWNGNHLGCKKTWTIYEELVGLIVGLVSSLTGCQTEYSKNF